LISEEGCQLRLASSSTRLSVRVVVECFYNAIITLGLVVRFYVVLGDLMDDL